MRKYWVSLLLGNALIFLFSFQLRESVYAHDDVSLFLWIVPLAIVAGLVVWFFLSEASINKFWVLCILSLLFWSRVFFEIANMEPCFAGRRPFIAFWMISTYHEPP